MYVLAPKDLSEEDVELEDRDNLAARLMCVLVS